MRREINEILRYPENSAGSIMTTEYVSLRPKMTVAEAITRIRRTGVDKETIYTCYVTEERRLLGAVSVKDLLLTLDDETPVSEIMDENVISVNTLTDQEEVAQMLSKYNFLALPVVDQDGRMVGIVTFDDAMDILVEETTEDIQKMAGVAASTDEYLDTSVWQHMKNRLPWLIFLMISSMITGAIIVRFEGLLSQVISLVSYLPLLMGTGGNSGSQAATLVIRSLSIGELDLRDAGAVFWKEIRVGFCAGLILSILNCAKILLIDGEPLLVAITVCGSLLLVIMLAKSIGAMLPLLAKRLNVDPALMASPMIASLNDLITVVVYFLLATSILGL
jgi:magnesium transporter